MPETAETLEPESNTSLKELLKERIRSEGAISFHDWMEAALYDPKQGYYNRSDLKRWGREGDYRTSPERSELFAATFARYFNHLYERLGKPSRLTIVECGAGDGTFAQGLLSNLQEDFPELYAATSYYIDEISGDAKKRIQEATVQFDDRVSFATLADVTPLTSAIVFSNELLDAFPVHRLVMSNARLREQYVSLDDTGEFAWTTSELSNLRLAGALTHSSLAEGQIVDVNLGIEDWIGTVAAKLIEGYVVTVDYGHEAEELYRFDVRPKGTLRAYSRHGFVENVLGSPGEYDITTSVDWSYIKEIGRRHGLQAELFSRLDQFLLGAGALDELQLWLERTSSQAEKIKLSTAAREMILPGGMASSFQVLVQSLRLQGK